MVFIEDLNRPWLSVDLLDDGWKLKAKCELLKYMKCVLQV